MIPVGLYSDDDGAFTSVEKIGHVEPDAMAARAANIVSTNGYKWLNV